MATINITGSNTTTGELVLKDPKGHSATKIFAQRNEVITWVILPTSGVSSIKEIKPKPNNQNIFSEGPAKLQGSSRNWQGRINPGLDPGESFQEEYFIEWVDGGIDHKYDPLIQINP